ncbi:MAG: lipopolysaccharide biosynthesis protein [Bacteroides sp.]|nr:lipopolysaccharide biosynthesis protein [Bacteroides sp.]
MKSQANVYKWSTIDRVFNTVITFGANIALARMLDPDDFGLLAMVAIFIAIAYNLSSCGMSDGLIKKIKPTAADYSTVFTFNVCAGLIFCALFIGFAGLVADCFHQPALVNIMRCIGVCFVFQVMWFVQETKLRKELEMKKIAIVRVSASASAAGLGIILAYKGYTYWGLVSCRIFLSVFQFIYYVIATRWIPRLGFYRESFREMFGFGINLMMAYIINQVSRNINTSVLGRFSPSESGIFSQAQKMEEVPYSMIDTIINSSFFAIISNESSRDKRHTLSTQMLGWMTTITVTAGLLLTLLAGPGFNLLFGAKWDGAVPVFRILLFFGIGSALKYYFQAVMKSFGMARRILWLTVLEIVIQLSLLALFYRNGMLWIAWTQVAGVAAVLTLYAATYCRIEQIRFIDMLRISLKGLIVPVIAFAITAGGYILWDEVIPAFANCVLTMSCFTVAALVLWELFPTPLYLRCRKAVISRFTGK